VGILLQFGGQTAINLAKQLKSYKHLILGTKLEDILAAEDRDHFNKKISCTNITKPWVGILHYPEFIEEMNYESFEAFPNILKSKTLIESIQHCKCIITLSQHLQIYVNKILEEYNYNIPVKILYHPSDFNCKLFNYNSFNKNRKKKLIQIGFWMRKGTTIYKVQSHKFEKYWLPGGEYWKTMFSTIYSDFDNYLNDESVVIKMYLSNEEYDNLLSKNLVLLDVFNSSANNTVLECIVRNTPLIVNQHPAIVEYLGIQYPLYFNSIDELNTIINSGSNIPYIIKTLQITPYPFRSAIFCIRKLELVKPY
jgi:hypothetical protein